MNSANIPLKSLSEKIRQYLSGEGVPEKPGKPVAPDSMKGRVSLSPEGEVYVSDQEVARELDYKAAYEDARNLALELKQKYPDLPKLPPCNSNPITGLQDLLEWCIDTGHLQQQADFFEEEEAKRGKFGFHKKPPHRPNRTAHNPGNLPL